MRKSVQLYGTWYQIFLPSSFDLSLHMLYSGQKKVFSYLILKFYWFFFIEINILWQKTHFNLQWFLNGTTRKSRLAIILVPKRLWYLYSIFYSISRNERKVGWSVIHTNSIHNTILFIQHLRMLWTILISSNVKGHRALYKFEQIKNTTGKEGLLKLSDESQLNNDDYKVFSISLEVDTTLCLR